MDALLKEKREKNTIRVLPEFARQNSIRGSSSRPFWRSQSRFNTAKQRGYSLRMDRLKFYHVGSSGDRRSIVDIDFSLEERVETKTDIRAFS